MIKYFYKRFYYFLYTFRNNRDYYYYFIQKLLRVFKLRNRYYCLKLHSKKTGYVTLINYYLY